MKQTEDVVATMSSSPSLNPPVPGFFVSSAMRSSYLLPAFRRPQDGEGWRRRMGIEPTYQLVTGTTGLKPGGPTRCPTASLFSACYCSGGSGEVKGNPSECYDSAPCRWSG